MCLNFVFGKYGYLKYLFPSPEWLHDRVAASHREKEDNEEGGVFQQDQGRHHFNQIISKFRVLGAVGQRSEGCLWHIAAYSQNSFMYFYFIFKKK